MTTGYKCFRRDLLKKIDISKVSSKGYAFQIETSFKAKDLGANIKEIPIVFIERSIGNSKMSAEIMLEGAAFVSGLIFNRLIRRRS